MQPGSDTRPAVSQAERQPAHPSADATPGLKATEGVP